MMPSCKMNETKLEVTENYEEADLSDVDDDVFVRSGGRNGYCLEYDIAKKPLMTPRKKTYGFDNMKNGGLHTEVRSSPPALKVLCMPMCYIMIATFAMLGLVAVITFLTSYVSWPLSILNLWTKPPKRLETFGIRPCDNIHVEDVWVQHFPKLLTESAFRLLDVNNDSVDDVVFGYATGADGYGVPEFVCDIYFAGQNPCFGGVLALDGRDGSELWRHWTAHEVYALNCQQDISGDDIRDCLISGRAGVFCAISGADGSEIWTFEKGPAKNPIMNVYTAQFIRDLNNDGVIEILAVHGGDPLAEPGSLHRLSGRLLILSGKTGEVLQWVETPDGKESYYSPQILTGADGTDFVLFGTGGETHGGGLYLMSLADLYNGIIKNAKLIYRDEQKGIMIPPVITDITGDGVDDIIMAMFNSTVVAFDGTSFQQIWNHTFPSSETYTTPTPGFFNEDEIPDFLVKYQTGPGFPVYYHAQSNVLDGKTGKPLLENPIIDTIGSQASTPLIRTEGYGNDIFLYWSSNCKGHEGNSSEFSFKKGTNIHEQSRSDLCKLRFGSKLVNQLRAFNRATGARGFVMYDSEERDSTEHNNSVDTSQQGQAYLQLHPEMWQYFDQQQQELQPPSSSSSQQSYKLMGGQDIVPETIPSYPASAMMPGAISSGNVYGYPLGVASNIYDLSSQPELTEEVKYPMYHAVRKHGNYGNVVGGPSVVATASGGGVGVGDLSPVVPVSDGEVAVGMSNGNGDGLGGNLNINLNRRQYQEFGGGAGGNVNQHHLHRATGISQHSSPGVALTPENPIDSNGMTSNMGDVPSSSAAAAADALSSSSGGKQGDISPEMLWENYYRNVGVGVGGGVATRSNSNGDVDDSLVDSRRSKYLPAGNDPYEKRSGGGGSNIRNHHHHTLLDDRLDAESQSRNGRGQMYADENGYIAAALQPQSIIGMGDIDNAVLEQKRQLLQRQQQQQQLPNSRYPFWNGQSNKLHENNQFASAHARYRRHIGPHDGGIQRLISTGTLAKPLNNNGSTDGMIDLIFATYWFFPAKTQIISAKSKECIEEKMSLEKQRFEESRAKAKPTKDAVPVSNERTASAPVAAEQEAEAPAQSDKDNTESSHDKKLSVDKELTGNTMDSQPEPEQDMDNKSIDRISLSSVQETGKVYENKDIVELMKPADQDQKGRTSVNSGSCKTTSDDCDNQLCFDEHGNPIPMENMNNPRIIHQKRFQPHHKRPTYKFESAHSFEGNNDAIDFDIDGLITKSKGGCNFCTTVCGRQDQLDPNDPLLRRPSWIKFVHNQPNNYYRSKCQWMMNQHRLREYLSKKEKRRLKKAAATSIIVDDKGHLFPSWKQVGNLQKRPLWGAPTLQWDIDEKNGKHGYRTLTSDPPQTPLPTFFREMPPISEDICFKDDANIRQRRPHILVCHSPFCARKISRRVNRDYRGKHPIGVKFGDLPPGQAIEDPLIKQLMEEMHKVFVEFLARKVPIIWIYGRPIKSVAEIRRRHCIQLAETHGFTYISLDEEVALLAAKGSKAIQAGNPYFEGFSAVERLAIPVCIKLAQVSIYSLNRYESLELLKFLMLMYWPTNGYVIDGFPWDDKDNEDFEKTFYPISAGIYFLDSKWTTDKTRTPEVIPPLYFKRNIKYDENLVEAACGNFGLKTIKIINCETLDEEMSYAVNSVVDEYLDAYDEVLAGNEDVLRDNDLELEKFGETVGYGLDLEKYMKRKPETDVNADGQEPMGKLKEAGWDGSKGKGEYTSAIFDTEARGVKVTPSKRRAHQDGEGKDVDGGKGHDVKKDGGDGEGDVVCPEDDEKCKEKKKHDKKERRRRKHCCKCCKCHKKRGDGGDGEGDTDPSSRRRRRRHDKSPRTDDSEGNFEDDDGRRRKGRKGKKGPKAFDDSHSEPDEEMGEDGPFVYDKKWGFRATRRAGKHPDIRVPRITTPGLNTNFKEKEKDLQKRAKEGAGVYALPQSKSHQIPDPYNTLPHQPGDKPGDYLHDYPGPNASDRFSKINRKPLSEADKLSGLQAPVPTTPYAEEPTSGLRSLFSDTMSRIIAKNQADIRKIKYDKLKHKVAQVEYEIYQDDYRLPKYRFYKTYKDYTPEDFIKERQNWIPCADCFDSFKQAEQFHRGEQIANLSHIKHDRNEQQEEHDHQYGKGPLFNRMVSCLCGEDNEAGFHIPGYKPTPKIIDDTDIERFNEYPPYKQRKP